MPDASWSLELNWRENKQTLHSHLSTVVLNATEGNHRVSEQLERADLAQGAAESFPVQVMLEPNSEGRKGLNYMG